MAASSSAGSGLPPPPVPSPGDRRSSGGVGEGEGGARAPSRRVMPTLAHQRTEYARRHDTAAIRVEVAVDSAVESEQAVHVPVTSSHMETALSTMKSLVAGACGRAGMRRGFTITILSRHAHHRIQPPNPNPKHHTTGGLAGMLAKSVVAPVDRIKILFQVSSEPFSLRKVFNLMRRIHREEGLGGLWKGNSATMLR